MVVVFGIVAKYGIESLYMCTLLTARWNHPRHARYHASWHCGEVYSKASGRGIYEWDAVIIASTQIKDFFGLKIDKVPGDFLARIEILCKNVHTLQASGTALGCPALAIIIACNRPPLWPPVISRWRWFQ